MKQYPINLGFQMLCDVLSGALYKMHVVAHTFLICSTRRAGDHFSRKIAKRDVMTALGHFYRRLSFAATGVGLPDTLLSGTGTLGAVTGGALVPFADPLVAACARELAADERAHVAYLRAQLAAVAVAQPAINISGAADGPFTTLMRNAGVIGAGAVFNPYANDNSFLLGAYVFADVAVSAYKGGVPLIVSPTIASAAAGILGAEGYHAGLIRTLLYTRGSDPATGLRDAANKISDERDRLDGTTDIDQGITQADGAANIVPADGNGIAYSRSAAQVLNILYLNKASVNSGGFFPAGLNGNLKTSAAS